MTQPSHDISHRIEFHHPMEGCLSNRLVRMEGRYGKEPSAHEPHRYKNEVHESVVALGAVHRPSAKDTEGGEADRGEKKERREQDAVPIECEGSR